MAKLKYDLDWVSGFCPVQAEGTYRGKHFYFRSRGNRWAFYIGTHHAFDNPEWHYSEAYGEEPFVAGWITEEEALGFIEKSLEIYRTLSVGK